MKAALLRKIITLAGLLAAAFSSLSAATVTWSGTTGSDWNTAGSWSGGAKPLSADIALFSSGSLTVANAVADQTVTSIQFGTASLGNITIGATNGNKLNLNTGGSISILNTVTAANSTETINSPLVLTPSSGTGNVTYSFSNAATTTTVLMSVAGSVSGGTTTGTAALTLTGSNAGNNAISGLISDGGAAGGLSVVKASSGKWVLSNNANTFSGGISINSGTISTGSIGVTGQASALGTNGTIKVGSQGSTTLLYTGAGETSDKSILLQGNNGLGLYSSGTGAITISGNISSITAVATNNNLQIRGSGGTVSSPNVLAGVISEGTGALSIIKSDASAWALTGANTYTGNTTVNNGTLLIGNGGTTGQLGSGNVIMTANGTLAFDRSNAMTVANVISGPGNIQQIGSGTTTLTGANTFTSVVTLTSGTLSVGSIGNGGAASGNLGSATNAAANLVFNGGALEYTGADASTDRNFTINSGKTATIQVDTNNLTMSGASTATSGALTKAGSGTLTLSGTQLYTGATQVSAGTLVVNGSIAASSGVSLASGTSLAGTGTTGAVTLAGNNVLSSAGTLTTGGITVNGTGNSLGSGIVTGHATINSGADFSVTSGSTLGSASVAGLLTNNGSISGAVDVSSGGTLKGSGTFASDVTINSGGTLAPGNSPGLQVFSSNLTLNGTTQLEISGTTRGTTYDGINIGSTLTYGGALHVTFGSAVTDGSVFGLFSAIDGTSAPVTGGTFDSVVFAGSGYDATLAYVAGVWQATNLNGFNFTFNEGTGALTASAVAPVPEPATYAAILGGLALVGAIVRRRRMK